MPGAVKEPSNETTLDVSIVTMEVSHPNDAEREPKPIICDLNTDIAWLIPNTSLFHDDSNAAHNVSLPTIEASHHDAIKLEPKTVITFWFMVTPRQHFMSPSQHCKHFNWRLLSCETKEARSNSVTELSKNKLYPTLKLVDAKARGC